MIRSLSERGIVPLHASEVPAGRLQYFLKNWEVLTKDRWILETVRGYKIEFRENPRQQGKPRPMQFNQSQGDLIQQEVSELATKGAIREIVEASPPEEGSFYSTLFLVPKKDGGQRPVINLKALNQFVIAPHFKMEGIHTLKTLLRQGDWLVKIDLKDAYFAIPIREESRKFLSFSMADKNYQFTCLPFGLASAPWVFTKTLRPVVALGRELGVRLVIYIDDMLVMAESKEKAEDQASGLTYLLQCLGFTINTKKSVLDPTQSLEFLGFLVNSLTMELSLPTGKLKKIRAESRKLLGAEQITNRALSRLIGKMSAANQVIPPSPLFYRHLQMDLTESLRVSDQNYETTLTLSHESKEELTWWDTQMSKWNGRHILAKEPDLVIESDASTLGWGASCQNINTGGPWSAQEKTNHINCLELLAATLALKTFVKNQTGVSVLLKIDNTTAVAYINNQGGTVSKTLVTLTRDLWMWCLERNIHIQAQHLPGVLNYRADTESRTLKDRSDWSLDKDTFSKINERYGPIEVDLFASRLTNQCRRYFSWRPDPYAEATDAFLQDWSSIRGFANPPWNMIPRVIMKTQSQKADVILVTPIWKSQPWYAILPSMMVDWPRLLPTQHSAPLNPPLAVWSISGNDSTVKAFQAKLQSSSSAHGEQKQTSPMTHSLDTGVAGVINGKQIHFQDL